VEMRRLLPGFIILFLVLASILPVTSCKNSASGPKTYTNSEYGFTVDYPSDWKIQEGASNTIVQFNGPTLDETGGKVNINIVNEQLPASGNMTLDGYFKAAESQLAHDFENFAEITTQNITVSSLPAVKMLYTFKSNGYQLKANQVYLTKNNVAYTITMVSTVTTYDKYDKDGDIVINSFKFK
jgi:hypothetical protein